MEIVVMPKLGFNMDEGKLTSWYKKEGESITKGEPLFAIETDKTTIDVEATSDGIVRRLFIGEGDAIPVTLPIAIIAEAGEDIAADEAEAMSILSGVLSGGASASGPVTPAAPAPTSSAPTAVSAPEPSFESAAGDSKIGDESYDFDVFVIGGGPGGYVAAIRARQLGLRTAVAEKNAFGGVCLNCGCIPTKTFLRSVDALEEVKHAAEYGVTGLDAKAAKLDMKKVQARKQDVVSGLVAGVEGLLAKNKATALKGEVKIIDKNTVEVDGKAYKTANLIIATGSDVKGLPDGVVTKKDAWTSNTMLAADKLPKDIVIIGGGVIGVEFAFFLANAGTKVTIVEFLDRILPPVDGEIAALVHSDLEKQGIVIHTSAKVTAVTESGVTFEKGGAEETIKTKNVLLAVGRSPVISDDAAALGLETERGAIVTDAQLRTSVPGVYAIGDVNGKIMLAHTASAEGIVAVETIAGMNSSMDYTAIPSAIYIKPEVASVGLSEEDARAKYGEINIGKYPMAANGKSRVEGDTRGLIKVITDKKYGEILGVHLYCLHATDMIAEAAAAMTAEATAEEMVKTVHPHPTVSEAVQEAFHAALGGAINC